MMQKSKASRPVLIHGRVEGIDVGQTWLTRQDLSESWVHRPKSGSIHAGADGVFSILINSKYRGMDNGMTITYAGPKIKTNGKYGGYFDALIKTYNNRNPVRVIRGPKRNSSFAPTSGFRFDGLYQIEKYWKDNDHICFCMRRLINQNVAPWIKRISSKNSSLIQLGENKDNDISPYLSFIRCQSRTVLPTYTLKQELIGTESNENDCTNELDSSENGLVGNSILPDGSSDGDSNVVSKSTDNSNQLPQCEEKTSAKQPKLVGGVPVPKVFKEEMVSSAGLVVMETLPQDAYEVYNENIVHEEQEAEFTECDSDEDCWVDEEEIDSQIIKDVGDTQIVTALSLSPSDHINNQTTTHGLTYEVDVEDGPKFGLTMRSFSTNYVGSFNCTPIIEQNQIKIDQEVVDNILEEENNPDELLINDTQLPKEETENSNGECLYIYPATKCESVDEAEQAILNGNFHWYQGNRPPQDHSKLLGCTLHEFNQLTLNNPKNNDEVSKTIEVTDRDLSHDANETVDPNSYQQLSLVGNHELDRITDEVDPLQCQGEDGQCPYNDITLGELMSYTLNEMPNGCVCRWAERLPCMNQCMQQILQARKSDCLAIRGKEKNSIIPRIIGDSTDGGMGIISHVESFAGKETSESWNDEQNGGVPLVQESVLEESSDDIIQVDDTEPSDIQNVQGMIPRPISLINETSSGHKRVALGRLEVFWRAIEEVRDEAIRKVYKIPLPKLPDDNDGLKIENEGHSLIDAKSSKVEEVMTNIPNYYSERKETFLHHMKRKVGNLAEEYEEQPLSPEVSEPPSKLRMVKVRNIRTEINRTRIISHQLYNQSSQILPERNDSIVGEAFQEEVTSENDRDDYIGCSPNDAAVQSESLINNQYTSSCFEDRAVNSNVQEIIILADHDETTEAVEIPSAPSLILSRKKREPRKKILVSPRKLETQRSTSSVEDSNGSLFSSDKQNVKGNHVGNILDSTSNTDNGANNQIDNIVKVPSSPDSDNTSFERVCEELCEVLPKKESDYSVPGPASLVRKLAVKTPSKSPSAHTEASKAINNEETFVKKKVRSRTSLLTPTKEDEEVQSKTSSKRTSSKSTIKIGSTERLNTARHLKGFTIEDINRTKQFKVVFDNLLTQCIKKKSLHNIDPPDDYDSLETNKCQKTRAKSSRSKQKARRFNI